MKNSILILLLSLAYNSNLLADNRIRLTGIVDSIYTQESQWVYWFTLTGNEYAIVDSCFLQKGEEEFHFQSEFVDDDFISWITFSKAGPIQLELDVVPGEDATIFIDSELVRHPRAKGSVATMEQYELGRKYKWINEKIDKLAWQTRTCDNDSLEKSIKDSIEYYINYRSYGIDMDFLRITKSGRKYASAVMWLRDRTALPQVKIDSLESEMLRKFPQSKSVKNYFNEPQYPSSTENCERAMSKFDELMENRNYKPQKGSDIDDGTKAFLTSKKENHYIVGSKVADIVLEGIDGTSKKLSDIKEKYILIDFWASWCGPCSRSYPQLLKVQNQFNSTFRIYAISIDSNQSFWKSAVGRLDPTKQFTHVRAIPNSESGKDLSKMYGITHLPANFLLDENREIIAIDLSGEELEEKMRILSASWILE